MLTKDLDRMKLLIVVLDYNKQWENRGRHVNKKVEAEVSKVEGQPQPHSKFKNCLG